MVDTTNPLKLISPAFAAKDLYYDPLFSDTDKSPFKYIDEATDYKRRKFNPLYNVSEREALEYAVDMGASDSLRGIAQMAGKTFGWDDFTEDLRKRDKVLNSILSNPEYGGKAMGAFLTSAIAADPVTYIPIVGWLGKGKKAKSLIDLAKYGMVSGAAVSSLGYVPEDTGLFLTDETSSFLTKKAEMTGIGTLAGGLLGGVGGGVVDGIQRARGKPSIFSAADDIEVADFADDFVDVSKLNNTVEVGSRVVLKDTNKIGTVIDLDESKGIATVHIISKKTGKTETRRFVVDDIRPPVKGNKKTQFSLNEKGTLPVEVKFIIDRTQKGNPVYKAYNEKNLEQFTYSIRKALDPKTKKPLPNAFTVTRTIRKPNPLKDPDNLDLPPVVVRTNLGTFKKLKDAKAFVKASINNRRPPKNKKELVNNIVDDAVNPSTPKYKLSNPVLKAYQKYLGIPLKNIMFNNPAETVGAVMGYNIEAFRNSMFEDNPDLTFAEQLGQRLISGFAGAAVGVGAVKGGRYLTNAAVTKNLNYKTQDNTIREWFGRGIISDYGLDESYLKLKQQFRTDKNTIGYQFYDIVEKASKELDLDQRRMLYFLMTGDQLELQKINQKLISGEMKTINAETRTLITKYAGEFRDAKLLNDKTFKKNINTYLKQSFRKPMEEKAANKGGLKSFYESQNEIRIMGDEFKPRGKIEIVTKNQFNRKNTKYKKSDGWELLEELKNGKLKIRRQYTKEERLGMEEIEDAAFAIAETGRLFANDIATTRFFKELTEMEGIVLDEAAYKLLTKEEQKRYRQASKASIGETRNKKFGEIGGKYVDRNVLNDLEHMYGFGLQHDILSTKGAKVLDDIQTFWKKLKTAFSWSTHVGNTMSNTLMIDAAGVKGGFSGQFKLLREAHKEMMNPNSAIGRQAKIDGIFDVGFVSTELKRIDLVDEYLAKLYNSETVGDGIISQYYHKLKNAKLVKTLGPEGWERLYQYEDQIFRMALYLDRIKNKGMSRTEAAMDARKWFIDYDINAPVIRALKRTVVPFISYTYRVIPLLAETAAVNPHKFAKWAAVGYAMNNLGQYMTDDKEGTALDREVVRKDLARNMFGGIPVIGDLMPYTNIRLPVDDSNGNAVYLDVARWLPGGDIFEQRNTGAGFTGLPGNFQPGGVYFDLLANFGFKKDPFTGQDLADLGVESNWEIVKHFTKKNLPNIPGLGMLGILPAAYGTEKVLQSLKQAKGKEEAVPAVFDRKYVTPDTPALAIAYMFGIRLRPQDSDINRTLRNAQYERELSQVQKLKVKNLENYNEGKISLEKYEENDRKFEEDKVAIIAERNLWEAKVAELVDKISTKELKKAQERQTNFEGGEISEDFPVTDVKENASQRINPFTNEPYLDEQMNRLGFFLGGEAEEEQKRIERIPAGMDRERTTEEVIRGILDGVIPSTNLKTLEKEKMTEEEEDAYIRNLSKQKSFMENDATEEEREAVLNYVNTKPLTENNTYYNPGNIEIGQNYAGETGETYANDRPRPFVVFDSPESGLRALMRDITTKVNNLDGNLMGIINRYAPPADNNPTSSYYDYVKSSIGNKEKVTVDDVPNIVKAIIMFENAPNKSMTEEQRIQAQKRLDIYLDENTFNTAIKLSKESFPGGTSLSQMLQSLQE